VLKLGLDAQRLGAARCVRGVGASTQPASAASSIAGNTAKKGKVGRDTVKV